MSTTTLTRILFATDFIDTATMTIVARHKAGASPFGGSLLVRAQP